MPGVILEKRLLIFRLKMERIIFIYSSRLQTKMNYLTLENINSFSLKIILPPLFVLCHGLTVFVADSLKVSGKSAVIF